MDKGRLGKYVVQDKANEPYKAYIPPRLPPELPIDLKDLYPLLDKATRAIGALNSLIRSIPNPDLFVLTYIRREALLSSQIEGTQSSFSDLILFEHHQKPNVSIDDVEEVSNYIAAMNYGLKRLKNFPLSLRLLREIHGVLLQSGRGAQKLPGEFRRSQNWLGGTRPGNALFVPPPPECLISCLDNFEKFLHDKEVKLPILIKVGLAHVQFETIHPFLDGNGRLGRLLIILLLCEAGILEAPVLYLSLYFKQDRDIYYDLLQQVRTHGAWEAWLEFFLIGIAESATEAVLMAKKINSLFDEDVAQIKNLGRIRFSCLEIFEYLKKLPQVSVPFLSRELSMTAPTVRSVLNHLTELEILKETSGKKRDKIYIYQKYLDILEYGAQPTTRNILKGQIEPHFLLLKQPSDSQKLYKIVSVENFIKSVADNYLHFQRVDSYKDFLGPDKFDGAQLPLDRKSNADSKFAKDPSFTAETYYDSSRSRTYACCFSLENLDYIWKVYGNEEASKGKICLVFNFGKLRQMLNQTINTAKLMYGNVPCEQIFSINYGIVDYRERDSYQLNTCQLPNPIQYTFLKDKKYIESD